MKIILNPEFQIENSKSYSIRSNEIVFSEWNNVYKLSIGESFTVIFQSELEFQKFAKYTKDSFLALTKK